MIQNMETAAAKTIDAILANSPAKPTRRKKPRRLTKTQIVNGMAEKFREAASVTGGATEQCLRDANYTASQISAYSEEAAERARMLANQIQ